MALYAAKAYLMAAVTRVTITKVVFGMWVHRLTRHRASTSTRWHFAFAVMLSQQWNPCRSQIRPTEHN